MLSLKVLNMIVVTFSDKEAFIWMNAYVGGMGVAILTFLDEFRQCLLAY